jgi:hypothetical protein
VHDARAEHPYDLVQKQMIDLQGLFRGEMQVAQPWCRIAIGILDQLHHQHAVDEGMGSGDTHVRVAKSIDHFDLRRTPCVFIARLPVLGALRNGALISAVAHLPTLDVVSPILE